MSETREIYLKSKARSNSLWLSQLQPIAQVALRFPFLPLFRPGVRRLLALVEPAGRLFIKSHPSKALIHSGESITILSANLWHDWPLHRKLTQRLETVAGLIEAESVDIALLQEVARTRDLRADQWLGERLGMAYVYSRANGHQGAIGFEEGLAVFSRYPLNSPRLKQLGSGTNPFVRRLALGATIDTPGGSMVATSVHLSLWHRQNAIQMTDLQDWSAAIADKRPMLIGGDFNSHENTSQIIRAKTHWLDIFRQLHPDGDGTTHELRWPWGGVLRRRRLDYLFLQPGEQPWKILEVRHLDSPEGPHSDHRALLARLAPVN